MAVQERKTWERGMLSLAMLAMGSLCAEETAGPAEQAGYRVFDPFSVKNSHDLWIEGDALLWVSSLDGLSYAVKSDRTTSLSHAHVKEPDFDWDWGVRLGLGYKLPYDKWDIFINYTYVHAHAEGGVSDEDGAVFPQWQAPFGLTAPIYATHAKAHWNANVNIGDIELGRDCFVANWLSIRPFMGVRGLVIDQDYDVRYTGGTAVPAGDRDKVSLDNDFWGVGIRLGFDSLWGLGAGWSLYGNGAASLLSGHFSIHEHERVEEAEVTRVNLSNHVDNVIVTAEMALGIQWDYLFSKDSYHFGFKFGWEFNVFFDQNQLVRFVGDTAPGLFVRNDGDLSFQGLTFGMRFDF